MKDARQVRRQMSKASRGLMTCSLASEAEMMAVVSGGLFIGCEEKETPDTQTPKLLLRRGRRRRRR